MMIRKLRAWLDGRSAQDLALLRRTSVGVAVPALVLLLQIVGFFDVCDEFQVRVLARPPFFISAEDVQVSLLSPVLTFGLCVLLAFYLGTVLQRHKSLVGRSRLCVLAAVAVGLPGVLCVLWHGVVYVGQPLVSIFLLWLIFVPGNRIAGRCRR